MANPEVVIINNEDYTICPACAALVSDFSTHVSYLHTELLDNPPAPEPDPGQA
jgi:hypothetical protein